jgi:hypothetical protein
MRWRALALLLLSGCASWDPPSEEPLRGGDTRDCQTPSCVDVVVAVDTSGSSADPIDRLPEFKLRDLFVRPGAGSSSRLWTALDGLKLALPQLDDAKVAVALTGFAGDTDVVERSSWLEASLTNDYASIEAGVERMRARGADGGSCHACAVKLAASVLAPGREAGRCSLLVLLADAYPTLPRGPESEDGNRRDFAFALERSGIRHRVLVRLGIDEAKPVARLEVLMSAVDMEVPAATHADHVSAAIVQAVDSCD